VSAHSAIGLSTFVGIKKRKHDSKHKKNRADYESEQGIIKGKNGIPVFKRKIIDREHPTLPDTYVEYVRDKDGNIIVNKSEKLSQHTSPAKKKIN